jgi:hypothetical protein
VSEFRFVRPPVVIFAGVRPDPQTNIRFDTFVRLNRPLPRDRRGTRAVILLDDRVDLAPPTPEDKRKACFSEESGEDRAPQLRMPRDGQLVTVTIQLLRPRREVARAEVRARRVTLSDYSNNTKRQRFPRELGCSGIP